MKKRRTVVFDFDGVIHKGYNGWKDGTIYGEIDMTILHFMFTLLPDYDVVISSNRPAQQIVDFLNNIYPDSFEVFHKDLKDNMYYHSTDKIGVTNEKAVGILYVDDHGYFFDKNIDSRKHIDFILERLTNYEKDK